MNYQKKLGHMPRSFFDLFTAVTLALIAVWSLFIWQGHVGFSLWDEGFLWYGVQRVLKGEVPIRDFMSYDPGRYYWTALLASLAGNDGILSVRIAVAVFQTAGLFVGLWVIISSMSKRNRDRLFLGGVAAVTLVVWMFPRHKLFDISTSIFLLGGVTFLAGKPTAWRYFVCGVSVGMAAVLGRNHGVYGAVGSLGVTLWICVTTRDTLACVRGMLLWGVGVATGFLPVLVMIVVVPGFASSFWESVRLLAEQKATNLPLPVPWPWKADLSWSLVDVFRVFLIGDFFLGLLLFVCLAGSWIIIMHRCRNPPPAALVASVFLAIPYAHYAFSRADVGHLAQGIFPMLIGTFVVLGMLGAKYRWFFSSCLCVASIYAVCVQHPGWLCMTSIRCEPVEISGAELTVDAATVADVAMLRKLADTYAPDGRSFIAVPFWPGAYALLERKSPMWEIYPLFSRSETFQRDEIERIKSASPGFAFVFDLALDGDDALKFRNTHPLIYQYIQDNFQPVDQTPDPAYQIYRAGGAGQ